MVMLRKSDPLYFLDIRSVYPIIEGLVVSSPFDKMLFNIAFIACAYYFIYMELSLIRNSDLDKLVIVKLPFDRSSLQVWEFVHRLGTRWMTLTTRNISFEKVCSYPLASFTFSFVILTRSPTLNLARPSEI